MVFIGNVPPFHITQPSTDSFVQLVSPTATMVKLTCSLNVTIPSTMIVLWSRVRDNQQLPLGDPITTGSTTTLVIENFQQSDVGIYQCLFSDVFNSGWILTRIITIQVNSKFVMKPCMNVTN